MKDVLVTMRGSAASIPTRILVKGDEADSSIVTGPQQGIAIACSILWMFLKYLHFVLLLANMMVFFLKKGKLKKPKCIGDTTWKTRLKLVYNRERYGKKY